MTIFITSNRKVKMSSWSSRTLAESFLLKNEALLVHHEMLVYWYPTVDGGPPARPPLTSLDQHEIYAGLCWIFS